MRATLSLPLPKPPYHNLLTIKAQNPFRLRWTINWEPVMRLAILETRTETLIGRGIWSVRPTRAGRGSKFARAMRWRELTIPAAWRCVAGTGAGFSRQPGFGATRQVGHGGCQVQLEPGFGTAEVAGLADSHWTSRASRCPPRGAAGTRQMPRSAAGRGPAVTALPAGAVAPFVPYLFCRHALGPQGAYPADRRVESEGL